MLSEGADHDDNTDNISMFTKMPLLVTMMPINTHVPDGAEQEHK